MATGRIIRPRTQEGWDLLVPGRKPQGRVELSSKSELAAYLTNAIFPDIGLNVITNSLALRDTTGRRIIKGNNNAYAVSSAIQYYKNTQVNDVADELTVFAIVTHSVSNVFQLFVSRSESTKKTYQIGIESDGRVKATSWSSDAFKDLKVTTAWASVASAPFERHVIALRSDGSTLTLYSSVNGGETATAAFGALDNDGAGISILSRSSNDTGTTTTIPVLGGGVELVLEFNKALSDEELDRLIADPYQLFEPANDTPFLISIPGGGGAVYDETFSASTAGALDLTDAWVLAYTETFGATAASGATFTDTYDTPSVNYGETFAASAASGTELTDAWSLDYSETFSATAASGATLTDAWLLNYAETFAASSTAALDLTDTWALDYAETVSASATSGCDMAHSYAVGNDYVETFAASSVSVVTLTHAYSVQYAETFAATALADCSLVAAWALDYAETFAAATASGAVFTEAYETPAPGVFDETFAASSVSACDLTHAFSTPAAIGRVINPTLAASGVPARTLKGLKLIN